VEIRTAGGACRNQGAITVAVVDLVPNGHAGSIPVAPKRLRRGRFKMFRSRNRHRGSVSKYSNFTEIKGQIIGVAEGLRFVAKAVSNDETRYFMNFIRIEQVDDTDPESKFRAVGTDGRRMHIFEMDKGTAESCGLSTGSWKVIAARPNLVQLAKENPEKAGQFPNYRKILDRIGEPKHSTRFLGFDTTKAGYSKSENYQNMVDFFRSFPEKTVINFGYIADLTVGESWTVEWTDPQRAITFKSNDKLAVIMPMQAD